MRFELRNGATGQFHQIELTGGGVAVLDYNNDGCTDIFFTNGAAIPSLRKTGPEFYNRLFRNNCDMTFTDVTAEAGLAGEGYSTAVAIGDFDNDGFADIFVAGVKRNILYRNLGNGRFADVTAQAGVGRNRCEVREHVGGIGRLAGLRQRWLAGPVHLELRRLGCRAPSLAAARRKGSSTAIRSLIAGLPGQLFHNNHDGTFTDVSHTSGIGRHIGKGMGVAFADIDGDGLTDIFVANDSVRNFLFRNQGDGTFQEIGLEAGVALRDDGFAIAGMGADLRDFDNDGKPDLVVSGILNDSFQLFRNLGGARGFEDYGAAHRPADGHAPVHRLEPRHVRLRQRRMERHVLRPVASDATGSLTWDTIPHCRIASSAMSGASVS